MTPLDDKCQNLQSHFYILDFREGMTSAHDCNRHTDRHRNGQADGKRLKAKNLADLSKIGAVRARRLYGRLREYIHKR